MIAVIISMYDEFETVSATIKTFKSLAQEPYVILVESYSGKSREKISGPDEHCVLPDLSSTTRRDKLAAHAISRNFSFGFQQIYASGKYPELIICLTGDTLVYSASGISEIVGQMRYGQSSAKVLGCSQAIGQNFHARDADPINGVCGGRYQCEGISDFMPQFWIVDGQFAVSTKAFETIPVTNEFTSEQCLGDAFMTKAPAEFSHCAHVFAKNAYEFSNGIKYHFRGSIL